jgi:hypothetical protein
MEKLYKDINNKVHVIDENFKHLLPQGCVEITQAEANAILNPPPTFEQSVQLFENAIQQHLDDAARLKGYDNITNACSYAGAPNPFQAEAQSFITWRGNVWAYCYAELAKVQNGTIPLPTIAQIIAELPVRV